LCSFPRFSALRGLFRSALIPAFNLAHVTSIKADRNEEKTMTFITFALLLNAFANLFAALAKIIETFYHRRR
jgi:hypothetical protein